MFTRKSIKITDTIFGTNKDGEDLEIMPDSYLIEFHNFKKGMHCYQDYFFILLEGYTAQWVAVAWFDIKPFLGNISE